MPEKQRTRQMTQRLSATEYNAGGGIVFHGDYEFPFNSTREYISWDDDGPTSYNRCFHTRYDCSPSFMTYDLFITDHTWRWYNYAGSFTSDSIKGSFDPVDIGVSPFFVGRAFQAMRPKLTAEVSVPNFLLEFKEVVRLIPNLLGTLARWASKGDVAKTGADLLLTQQFGIAPLYRDLEELFQIWTKFTKELAAFEKAAGQPQTRHYKEVSQLPEDTIVASDMGTVTVGTTLRRRACDVTNICTMKYRYKVIIPPGFKNYKGGIPDTFKRYLGFRSGNVQAFWNAIPFSFLIDWVVGISGWLAHLDDGALPVELHVESCGVSTKYSRQCVVEWYEGTDPGTYTLPKTGQTAIINQKLYKREVVSPLYAMNSISLPVLTGLNIRELVLSWALITANTR